MFDMKKMMDQAQQMQFKMQELQEKFKDIYVETQAGGGLVKVVMNCAGVVQSVDIDPSLMSDDKETLEDMIVAAMNSANTAREERVQQESQALMSESGMNPNAGGGMLS